MSQLYTRRNIIVSFVISLAVVSFFVWYTYRNMKKAGYETRMVNTTLQSLRSLEDLMDHLQDIETGYRGYLISGEKQFLPPYNAALQNLAKDTLLIKTFYSLYPRRKDKLDELLKKLTTKTELSILTLNQLNNYNPDSTYTQIHSGRGRLIMDSIRQLVLTLENEDRKVLQYSNLQRDTAASLTTRLFGMMAAVFITILVILFLQILRGLKRQNSTERKIAYLADMVEQTGDAIISADTEFTILSWNKGAEEMYGYKKTEAIGKTYHLLLQSQRSDNISNNVIQKLIEAGYFAEELEYIRKNGEPVSVQASYTLLKNRDGNIVGCSIIHRDITEKKKAEKLLLDFNEKLNSEVQEKTLEIKEVLNRFKIIIRATNDVVWDIDLEKGTIWWNDNFYEKLGYTTADDTNSMHFWDEHIHPYDKARVTGHINYVLQQTDVNIWSNEYCFRKADGNYINIFDRSYIMRDENGKAIRMIGSMADVTDLFIARKELNQSEEKYRALVEQATDGIFLTSTTGQFVLVNSSICRLLGYSMEELMQLSIDDITDKQNSPDQPLRFAELREGKNLITERVLKTKNGELIRVEVNARPLNDGRVLAFVRDITEKRKVEEAIVKSNARFHIISKATSDIVWDLNLQDESIWWNDNYYNNLQYEKQKEFDSVESWNLRIHPEDAERVNNKISKAIAGKDSTWREEYRYAKSDGTYLNFLDRGYIIRDGEGKAYRMIGSMADITDLFLTREELKNSEERYRSLIEQATDAIMIYSFDGTIYSSNISAISLLGYTPEEFSKFTIQDFLIGDMIVDQSKHESILAGNAINIYRQFKRKDNSIIELEITAKLLSDGKVIAFGRDITERKKAEAKQQRQFDELQQLYDLAVISGQEKEVEKIYEHALNSLEKGLKADRSSILFLDEEGKMQFKAAKGLSATYKALAEDYSISSDDTKHQVPSLITDVENYSGPGQFISVLINEGIKSFGSIPIIYQDRLIGKCIIYYNDVHQFTENEIQFAQTIAHNIAFSVERHRANEALLASENRYHSLVEQAADAIALFDKKGKIIEVNNSALQLLGYSYNELMKLSLPDILTDEEIEKNPVQYDLLEKGLSTIKQRKMRRKDGQLVITEVNSKILPDGRFLSMVRDLTDRIEAQKQIEKEKELSDNIIDSMPGVFYLYDEKGKFIRWNKQFEVVTGYSAKEITGLHPTQFFEGEEKFYMEQRIANVFSEGVSDAEADFIFKNGDRKPYYFKAILVDFEGRRCLLGTGIDISDRKKAEKELNDSYKAIRKLTSHLQNVREEDRAHIAREIHDELGQQLTVLKMDVSWINKRIGATDDIVKQKMNGLLNMLDETVKTIRRISSELRPSLLDDLGLTAAIEWQLQEFKKRSGIKTSFTKPAAEINLSDMVKIGLFRIFQESLTNVVRHSQAKKLKVSLLQKNNKLILSIEDDGKGFDKVKIASNRTLGILGMKERTAMMGGFYEIIGIPGKGTMVIVTIPSDALV